VVKFFLPEINLLFLFSEEDKITTLVAGILYCPELRNHIYLFYYARLYAEEELLGRQIIFLIG